MRPDWRDRACHRFAAALGFHQYSISAPGLAIGRIEAVAGELAGALGVDLPKLPVVVSAPQWLEEQALAGWGVCTGPGLSPASGAGAICDGKPCNIGCAV